MESRFIIRREFFGAALYDTKKHCYKLLDNDTYKKITTNTENLCVTDEIAEIKGSLRLIGNEVSEGRLSAPLRIYIDTTYVCNLDCKFCYNKTDVRSEREIDLEHWESFFDQMVEAGVMKLSIAGGEPFADKNIFKIIESAKTKGLSVSLTSNGTLINNRILKDLASSGLKRVTISLDSADPAELEAMRPGLKFYRFKDNLDKISKLGIDIAIKCTFNHKASYSTLEDVIKFGTSLTDVKSVKFNYERLTHVTNYSPSDDEVLSYFKVWNFLDVLREKYRDEIKIIFNQRNPAIRANQNLTQLLGIGCPAGRDLLYVNPYGDVKGCALLPKEFNTGNIRKQSLKEIWGSSENLISLRAQNIHKDCLTCEYISLCGSGCTQRKILSGGLGKKDYYCYKEFLEINRTQKELVGLESYDLAHY